MSGARGDALEWALALARAPGERHALRQWPLPDGIETLLHIAAAGHGRAVQAAVARTGESEVELVEAVRFYLREVLFHSGADAYRMLGLGHDASSEQIKGHHRLLQQWLHPDRHTSDWDAIFAGRVNAAWNALRTPERRAGYDASHPEVTAPAPAATPWAGQRVIRAGVPIPADARADRWRRRAPVLALFAACGVLGIAAVRDALREPDSTYRAATAAANPAVDADPVALQLPEPSPRAARSERASPPRRPAATASRTVAAPAPPPSPRAGALVPRLPTAGVAVPAAPVASSKPFATMPTPREPVQAAAPILIAARTPLPAATPPPVAAAVAPPASGPRVTPSPIRAPVKAALAPPTGTRPAVEPSAPTASAERVHQAQRTGRQLLAFLSAASGTLPPIWDSLAAQQRAVRLRDSLHASGNTRAGDPQWRVAPEDAAMEAAFGDDVQVRARLVWREQRWLVSGVALEQGP